MTLDKIVFTMTAMPVEGGGKIFPGSVDHIVKHGIGGAHFVPLEVVGDKALLRGEIAGDPRMVTERGLGEYLTDTLASKQGIYLDLDVRLRAGIPLAHVRAA